MPSYWPSPTMYHYQPCDRGLCGEPNRYAAREEDTHDPLDYEQGCRGGSIFDAPGHAVLVPRHLVVFGPEKGLRLTRSIFVSSLRQLYIIPRFLGAVVVLFFSFFFDVL